MRRIGHFEFGIDRRPINVGDGAIGEVLQAFESGDEVRGQALYWASLHTYLADRLAANAALRAAVKVVRFEDLCRAPRETLSAKSEEHTSELQSLMRISYAVFCLKKKTHI